MKIAMSVKERSLDSVLEDRFARGKYFLIYDRESKEVEFIDPPNAAAHGAGPLAVNFLVNRGVDSIIAFQLGQNAIQAIEAAGVAFYEATPGTARENIQRVVSYKQEK